MIYQFDTQLKIGEDGEKYLDSYFESKYQIEVVGMDLQRKGIDRIFIEKSNNQRVTVEYKSDSKSAKTGNVFIETLSSQQDNKSGWAIYSEAQILIYYIPPSKTVLALPMNIIKSKIAEWKLSFSKRTIPNKGYDTIGILVPICELKKYHLENLLPTREVKKSAQKEIQLFKILYIAQSHLLPGMSLHKQNIILNDYGKDLDKVSNTVLDEIITKIQAKLKRQEINEG